MPNKITLQVKQAVSFKQRAFGLLLYKKPVPMIFKTRFGIHTFGMRYPIDIVILDNQQYVVKLKKSLQPNRIYIWPPLFDTVIELPKGTIEEKHIENGTHVTLIVE